jgi:hypothetical protein
MANTEHDWELEEGGDVIAPPPADPVKESPSVQPPVAPVAPVEEADNFPADLKESLVLLKQMQGAAKLPDKPTPQQRAKREKYLRLKKHVGKLQEGLPTIQTDAHSPAAFIGLHHASLQQTKLEHLARTNPLVKKLLAERDALKKENAELKGLLAKQT